MRTLLFTTLLIVLVTGTLQDSTAITNGGQVSAPEPSARSSASYGSMSLELRQAPAPAPVIPPAVVVPVDPAVPAPPGVVNPAPIPPIDPALPVAPGIVDPAAIGAAVPVAPAIMPTATTNPATPTLTGADYYSVKWVETWIGGTSQTWVPQTLLFHFEPMSPAPQPGEGVIGMGTLTGKPGQIRTFYMLAAAPTPTAVWLRGVVAAVGAGAIGMVA